MLRHIPSILINAEPVMPHGVWDVIVHGACDDAIHALDRQGLGAILPEKTGTIHEARSQGSPRAPQPARAEAGAGHCIPEAASGLQSSAQSPAQRQGQGINRCPGEGVNPERGECVWITASQGGGQGKRKEGGGEGRQRQERVRERGRRKHERKRGKEGQRSTEARAEGAEGRDGGRERESGAEAWRHEKECAISKVTVSAISKVTAKVTVSTRFLKQHSSVRDRERARERESLLASAAACKQEQASGGTFPRHAFPPAISALQLQQ